MHAWTWTRWVWAWRPPIPLAIPANLPPGCGPGDSPGHTPQLPSWVWAWRPPCEQNDWQTGLKNYLRKLHLRAVQESILVGCVHASVSTRRQHWWEGLKWVSLNRAPVLVPYATSNGDGTCTRAGSGRSCLGVPIQWGSSQVWGFKLNKFEHVVGAGVGVGQWGSSQVWGFKLNKFEHVLGQELGVGQWGPISRGEVGWQV